jgi:hypothetical protein
MHRGQAKGCLLKKPEQWAGAPQQLGSNAPFHETDPAGAVSYMDSRARLCAVFGSPGGVSSGLEPDGGGTVESGTHE